MKTVLKLAVAIALGVMGLAAPAAALDITVTDVEMPYREVLSLNSITVGGVPSDAGAVYAGQFVLSTNIGQLGAWCVDLFHTITLGPQAFTYSEIPLTSANNSSSPSTSAPLGQPQIARIQSLAAYGNAQLPLASDKNAFAAAVQAAIWKVEYGDGLTISGGSTDFHSYLTAIMAPMTLPLAGGVQLASLNAGGLFTKQNLELPVPEPGTLALVSSILVALGLLRRRLGGPGTSSI